MSDVWELAAKGFDITVVLYTSAPHTSEGYINQDGHKGQSPECLGLEQS